MKILFILFSCSLFAGNIVFQGRNFEPLTHRNYYQNPKQLFFLEQFYRSALRGPLVNPRGKADYELAKKSTRLSDTPLFDNIFIRVQDFSLTPSAASLEALSRLTSGKIVILYYGVENLDDPKLWKVSEHEGVQIEGRLDGKLYAIGEPKRYMVPYDFGSDNFLRTLAELEKKHPELFANGANNLLMGHGISVFDSLLTMKRIEDAGGKNPFNEFWSFSFCSIDTSEMPFVVKMVSEGFPHKVRAMMGGEGFATGLDMMKPQTFLTYMSRADQNRLTSRHIFGVTGEKTLLDFDADQTRIAPLFYLTARYQNLGISDCLSLARFLWESRRVIKEGLKNRENLGSNSNNGVIPINSISDVAAKKMLLNTKVGHDSIWSNFRAMEEVMLRVTGKY